MIRWAQFFLTECFKLATQTIHKHVFFMGIVNSSIIATAVCTGTIIAIEQISQQLGHGAYRDPLAAYDTIMPGMPLSALAAFPCAYQSNSPSQQFLPERLRCTIMAADAVMNRVVVEIQHGYITAITLYPANLKIGQLALHWQPAHPIQYRPDQLKWQSASYVLIMEGRHLHYESPVGVVHITKNPS